MEPFAVVQVWAFCLCAERFRVHAVLLWRIVLAALLVKLYNLLLSRAGSIIFSCAANVQLQGVMAPLDRAWMMNCNGQTEPARRLASG